MVAKYELKQRKQPPFVNPDPKEGRVALDVFDVLPSGTEAGIGSW